MFAYVFFDWQPLGGSSTGDGEGERQGTRKEGRGIGVGRKSDCMEREIQKHSNEGGTKE